MIKTGALAVLVVMMSFLLGFARDLSIAARFGTSAEADFIFLALLIPAIVENIFGLSVRDALIPYLNAARAAGREVARAVAARIGWPLLSGALVLTLTLIMAPETVIRLLVPGWSADLATAAAPSFQVGAVVILLSVWAYFLAALLHLEGQFVLPLWRTVFMNLGALLAMWLWTASAVVVLWGIAVSLALHLGWMQIRLGRDAFLPRRTSKGPKPFARFFVPLLVATLATQINVLAERFFASWLDEGTISQLSYAYRIATIPLTLFSLSVLSIVFTRLTQAQDRGETDTVNGQIAFALSLTFFLMVPMAVFLAVWSAEIVELLLQRGAFSATDTQETAAMLRAYCPGVLFLALGLLLSRVSLSLGRVKPILVSGVVSVSVTLGLDYALISSMGGQGLALAMSLGAFAGSGLLLVWLRFDAVELVRRVVVWAACGSAIFVVLSLWPIGGLIGILLSAVPVAAITLGGGHLDPFLRAEGLKLRRGES
ncbi:lipid II flippase MurJ [Pannonibacter phragmitetus]|uniref:lipid II flippase MurJ n=1 Tax=Pannonibacter phragmitetus TaxID=121719 RepID=UPI003D2F4A98